MPKLKNKIHVTTKEFYEFYAKSHFKEKKGRVQHTTHKNSKYYVTKKLYTDILRDYNLRIMNLILTEAFDYVIPGRLGIICIRKKKAKFEIDPVTGEMKNSSPINWKYTRELWKKDSTAKEENRVIRFFNTHSDHYVAKFTWKTKQCNFHNRSAYSFQIYREAKHQLGKIMRGEEEITTDYCLMQDFKIKDKNEN